ALARLTRLYFTSHGPATTHDFVWWSGLTMADARAGLAMCANDLAHEEIEGHTYWFSASAPPVAMPYDEATLLPTFDEFLVAYKGFGASRTEGRNAIEVGAFAAMILLGSHMVGSWRRTFKGRTMVMELTLFDQPELRSEIYDHVKAAAERYGKFLGMPVVYSES
ncbi:MAG TPA: crosslink repair DNA glycosylase YcaQ family protein, partial [Chloroflexia bacterium]|nr:crosslink repair DNA glycosylase YcaQ family protein [Chloroflexia bacterium]